MCVCARAQAKFEGVVLHLSTLWDTYFPGGKDHRLERCSATHIPYLQGDYWPGACAHNPRWRQREPACQLALPALNLRVPLACAHARSHTPHARSVCVYVRRRGGEPADLDGGGQPAGGQEQHKGGRLGSDCTQAGQGVRVCRGLQACRLTCCLPVCLPACLPACLGGWHTIATGAISINLCRTPLK